MKCLFGCRVPAGPAEEYIAFSRPPGWIRGRDNGGGDRRKAGIDGEEGMKV